MFIENHSIFLLLWEKTKSYGREDDKHVALLSLETFSNFFNLIFAFKHYGRKKNRHLRRFPEKKYNSIEENEIDSKQTCKSSRKTKYKGPDIF